MCNASLSLAGGTCQLRAGNQAHCCLDCVHMSATLTSWWSALHMSAGSLILCCCAVPHPVLPCQQTSSQAWTA